MDKLRSDKEIKITLYVDEQLKTKFMKQMLQDVQTLALACLNWGKNCDRLDKLLRVGNCERH